MATILEFPIEPKYASDPTDISVPRTFDTGEPVKPAVPTPDQQKAMVEFFLPEQFRP